VKKFIFIAFLFISAASFSQTKDSSWTIIGTWYHPNPIYNSILVERGTHTWQIQFDYANGKAFPKVNDKVTVTKDEKAILIKGVAFDIIRLTKKS
jgi:hypothetical protein